MFGDKTRKAADVTDRGSGYLSWLLLGVPGLLVSLACDSTLWNVLSSTSGSFTLATLAQEGQPSGQSPTPLPFTSLYSISSLLLTVSAHGTTSSGTRQRKTCDCSETGTGKNKMAVCQKKCWERNCMNGVPRILLSDIANEQNDNQMSSTYTNYYRSCISV